MYLINIVRILTSKNITICNNIAKLPSKISKYKKFTRAKTLVKKHSVPSTFILVPLSLYRREKPRRPLCPLVLSTIPPEVFAAEDVYPLVESNGAEPSAPTANIVVRTWRAVVEFLLYTLRFLRIVVTFTPVVLLMPPTFVVSRDSYYLWRWRRLLLATLESLGPTFIKLGQWAATRRDLFSADFCDMFSYLHDGVSTHEFSVTQRRLSEAFGERYQRIIGDIDEVPVGSGCIAQVHRGKLKCSMVADRTILDEYAVDSTTTNNITTTTSTTTTTNTTPEEEEVVVDAETKTDVDGDRQATHNEDVNGGEATIDVAIKVLHPHIYTSVSRDLAILARLADFCEFLMPSLGWLGFKESIDEFAELMMRQIDLRHEAVCLDRFIENFSDVYGIQFPKPIYPFCKREVLVETYEEGKPISSIIDLPTPDVQSTSCFDDCVDDDRDTLAASTTTASSTTTTASSSSTPAAGEDLPCRGVEEGSEQASSTEPAEPAIHTLKSSRSDGDNADGGKGGGDGDGGDPQISRDLRMQLGTLAIDALLQMIFIDNFVHGDLHPGNILIQEIPPGRRPDHREHCLLDIMDTVIAVPPLHPLPRWRLVLLDVGITATLATNDLYNFKSVFRSVAIGKGEAVAELMLKHARRNNCQDEDLFRKELTALVVKARHSQVSLSQLKIGDLLSDVFYCLSKHQVMVESNFASMLIAIFVLEGLGRSLYPELDLIDRAKPYLIV